MKVPGYNKILLTHDGSELASGVVPHVVSVACKFQSGVIVLQVIDTYLQVAVSTLPTPPYAVGVGSAETADRILKIERKAAANNLYKIKNDLEEAGVIKVTTRILEGNAADQIIRFVKDNEIDLVMMSTHGRSGVGRILLGSVADYVVRHAKSPVLLVHPEKE